MQRTAAMKRQKTQFQKQNTVPEAYQAHNEFEQYMFSLMNPADDYKEKKRANLYNVIKNLREDSVSIAHSRPFEVELFVTDFVHLAAARLETRNGRHQVQRQVYSEESRQTTRPHWRVFPRHWGGRRIRGKGFGLLRDLRATCRAPD